MAIRKKLFNTALRSKWEEVGSVLRDSLVTNLGIATSVTTGTDEEYTSDGIVVSASGIDVKIGITDSYSMYTVTVIENGQSVAWDMNANNSTGIIRSAITTPNGVLLDFKYDGTSGGGSIYYGFIIFTKTNTNKLGVIVNRMTTPYSQSGNNQTYYLYTYEAASGDYYIPTSGIDTRETITLSETTMMTQTSLVPFTFWPEEGETSYAPAALYAVKPTDFADVYSDRIIGTYHYVSNGLVWLKSDPV